MLLNLISCCIHWKKNSVTLTAQHQITNLQSLAVMVNIMEHLAAEDSGIFFVRRAYRRVYLD